jgi:hypothetical protein
MYLILSNPAEMGLTSSMRFFIHMPKLNFFKYFQTFVDLLCNVTLLVLIMSDDGDV